MAKKRTKLNEKISYIKKAFKTPYHFFYIGPKSSLPGIRFESKDGRHYEFTGQSMFSAVGTAEQYVTSEIENGSIEDPDKKEKTDENK